MTVQNLVLSIYFYPFAVRCVSYVTLSLTPGGQNLGQITTKRYKKRALQGTVAQEGTVHTDLAFKKVKIINYHLHRYITNISIILQLYQPLVFTLINPIWEGVSVTVR